MINSLKEGSGIEGLDSNTASTMELEELRHERDTQREEIQKLMGQIQQMRTELQVAMIMYTCICSYPCTKDCFLVEFRAVASSVYLT